MDKVMKDKKAIAIFVLPALLIFLLIVIIPIFMSGFYSALKWDGIGEGKFIGIKNYIDIFKDPVFKKSIVNSFILAFLSVFVQLPISLVLALVLARGIKGESFFRTIYFIPVVISTIVIGQLWLKIYHPDYGLLNVLLNNLGFESLTRAWLGEKETALLAAFIPILWQYIGYNMLLMYTGIKAIPDEIYEAAKIDGASNIRTAWNISIPLARPILKVCVVFAIIGSLKVFDLIFVLTNGGPVNATEVPSTLMYNTIFSKYMYGIGSSIAVFIIIECLILTVLIQKFFKVEEITY
ncbi:MAG: sugar ABC transporter permease [Clostridiales bacterium]